MSTSVISTSRARRRISPSAKSGNRPWSVFGTSIKSAPRPKFKMVSMFSGCGGADLGLRFAGFDILWANDIDAAACETYTQNIGNIKCDDIREIKLPRLKEKNIDLLAACFPCQSFSNAGIRRGTEDENGKLLNDWAICAVGHFKPKVVLFENVRGMLSIKDGDDLLIKKICDKLKRRGYHAYLRLVDASKHHVPQKRIRVFIVGVRIDTGLGEFEFPAADGMDELTLGHTIMDVPKKAPNQVNKISLGPSAALMCENIPEGGSWKDIEDKHLSKRFIYIRRHPEKYRAPNFYRCFGRNEIAGTITASFKPEHSGVLHPTEDRVYSVREAARIQSFPDWFKFYGGGTAAMCRQVGNAVPPRLAYEIGHAISELLSGKSVKKASEKITLSQFLKEKRPLRLSDLTIKHEKRKIS